MAYHVAYINSGDPDQTPQDAASGLGLYCLSVSLFWDTRYVNGLISQYLLQNLEQFSSYFGVITLPSYMRERE